MGDLATRGSALPSLEKARAILENCRSTKECLHIKALAQAVASVAATEQSRDDAAAIVLLAKARVGELTAAMVRADVSRNAKKNEVPGRNSVSTKQAQLAAEGMTRKDAAECEKIAALKASGDLDRLIRHSGATTTAAALAVQRMPPAERRKVFAKLGDDIEIKKAVGEVKLEAKRSLAEAIRANPVVTPDGRYQVIAIDPPWQYGSRVEDTTHRGRNQYPDMTTAEVCALPVAKLAQDDCVLWLWTTNAFMREAYVCLNAWGFKDKTILTWDKVNLGLGDWLRNVTEHCILAVRGRPVVSLTNQTTLISEKRREHSAKPEAFYSMVETLCPGSKLEMFSRTNRKGWVAWGAETGKLR
jgi:N6-adenosine-specific RNA methylase IME4